LNDTKTNTGFQCLFSIKFPLRNVLSCEKRLAIDGGILEKLKTTLGEVKDKIQDLISELLQPGDDTESLVPELLPNQGRG
jgi:hypothetical protein